MAWPALKPAQRGVLRSGHHFGGVRRKSPLNPSAGAAGARCAGAAIRAWRRIAAARLTSPKSHKSYRPCSALDRPQQRRRAEILPICRRCLGMLQFSANHGANPPHTWPRLPPNETSNSFKTCVKPSLRRYWIQPDFLSSCKRAYLSYMKYCYGAKACDDGRTITSEMIAAYLDG